jgi:hypothetical protein
LLCVITLRCNCFIHGRPYMPLVSVISYGFNLRSASGTSSDNIWNSSKYPILISNLIAFVGGSNFSPSTGTSPGGYYFKRSLAFFSRCAPLPRGWSLDDSIHPSASFWSTEDWQVCSRNPQNSLLPLGAAGRGKGPWIGSLILVLWCMWCKWIFWAVIGFYAF